MSEAAWEQIAAVSDVEPGGRLSVVVEDYPALLLRAGDQFYCIEDVCTHDGQPLTDGPVEGDVITCPRHGAKFSIKTGAALCMPATSPVRVFEVDVRDGLIYARSN
ncbi:MAG: non-heme iron oxygenase ferredoxin subunit [Planctomycetaceae bacterium]|nr:non-heme iron oxygenase ferredoxin subunit [Planctomycetaceae bacterium]